MLALASSRALATPQSQKTPDLSPILNAVNTQNVETLKSFSSDFQAEDFDWLRHKKKNWQLDILPMKHAEAQPSLLAVFHSWHSCESDGDHVFALTKVGDELKLDREIPEYETLRLKITDHNIKVKIDVPTRVASFSDILKLEQGSAETGSSLLMRISQDYKLSSLMLESKGKFTPVKFDQAGGVIAFIPPAQKNFTLKAVYAGKLVNRNGDYIYDDEAVINSYWYLHVARAPSTLTVTATAPKGWSAVGQGDLLKKTVSPKGLTTVTYRNEIPTCFFTIDFGKYEIETRKVGKRTYVTYLLPNAKRKNSQTSKTSLDKLEKAMAYFEKNFAPYPYTSYSIVETKGPFAGALEAYSFATFMTGSFDAIPHELSHTWWGGTVPCDYIHSMWNEGFASYSDNLFERMTGEKEKPFDPSKVNPKQRVAQAKRQNMGFEGLSLAKAYDTEDNKDGGIGYGKGEIVLRILEEQIGQDQMLKSMRKFFQDHKRGEIATWEEFEVAVNRTTGSDNRKFFEEWVERAGTPVIKLSGVKTVELEGGTFVDGDVIQSGDIYDLKLQLGIESKGEFKIETIQTSEAVTHFRFKSSGVPTRVWLDPRRIFPLTPPPTNDSAENAFVATLIVK